MPFEDGNKYGKLFVKTTAITCPHPDCREFRLSVSLHREDINFMPTRAVSKPQLSWQLVPAANSKKFPDYIPAALLEDYQEACEIRELSPKASATLSRRCLQGMIRDYWKVTPGSLYDEIEQIKDLITNDEWSAIDGVRQLGNIGAHMKKDISEIIGVDPGEAEALTDLIELLFEDWYIARHQRAERLAKVRTIAASKKIPDVS
jgi:hypothetical protein